MSTPIENNTEELQSILNAVNALPSAGSGGVELPTLENPGSASDLAQGKQLIDADGNVVDGTYVPLDTSDATATAGRILKGYTAYVNGKKITGNLNYLPDEDGTATLSMTANSLSATGNILETKKTFEISRAILPGSIVEMKIPLSKFGNATAADVVAGKTFTSAAGFLVEGTATGGGGGGSNEDFKAVIEGTAVNPTLPSDLTKIRNQAFREAKTLALTSLPSGVTSVGEYAFYGCSNLALTSLPSGLTFIAMWAFYGCSNLAITTIPGSVDTINTRAFANCTSLTSITFEGKPQFLNSSVFENCTNLTTINVPWAEGEVNYAPWGATNATINYNYTGG